MNTPVPTGKPEPSSTTLRALDVLAFLLADVQTGVGPFLAIYLAASRHWQPYQIGIALSAASISGTIAQAPAGWLIDQLRRKRELIGLGAALVAVSCVAMVWVKSFYGVLSVQVTQGILGAFFPPAMAGMTLGIVGRSGLDRRIGRNETFNHAGNAVTAALCGLLGYYIAQSFIFYFVAALSICASFAVLRIRSADIDFERARGADREDGPFKNVETKTLFQDRGFIIFTASVVLFHFANAAMLPLIGQRLSAGHPRQSALYMAVCIIGAQCVMSLVASPSAIFASRWGRKAAFLVGLGILPLRGVLYTLSVNPYFSIAVQLLDGVGAAIFGVVSVLVISDLTRGTGRFNFTQGIVASATGAGATLSTLIAEFVVQRAGFNAAFLFLAGIASAALALFWMAMPETMSNRPERATEASSVRGLEPPTAPNHNWLESRQMNGLKAPDRSSL